jgi:hypothetical protein
MTQHKQPEPLTPEQMQEIEGRNRLLKVFSNYVENLQKANPGVELPTDLIFSSFLLGASSVQTHMQHTTMVAAKEINELKLILFTLHSTKQGEQG